ncbi:MAG: hypothetical protein NTW35_00070 [Candidatus Nomurabacteria bacterium]|nr:hypothetical protein [Candidatus Nomurabacteria bacterium]
MKKILLCLILTIIIVSSTTKHAQAFLGFGDIVFDPAALVQAILSYTPESITATGAMMSGVQQTIDTINNNVLKPMKDAMTLTQIVKSGQLVNTLITASTGGDPLLVSNPKLYLQNKGIAVTQGGVDALSAQNGIFSNSIMNNVVAKAKKENSSLATSLATINQSSIPTIQKGKICNDTALSEMARSQVAASGGDYLTVKANLNSTLCTGNPSTDPALAKRLIAVSNKNPSLDAFYAITSGDNQYTKAQLSQLEIDKAAETAKLAATKDLSSGGGIKSQTTCTKFASNGLCIEDTVKQAASVLKSSYTSALGSDIATKISSIGSGAGSIIGTAFNAISLINGLTSAANGLTGAVGGSTGTGNSGTLATVTLPNGTVTTTPIVTNTTNTSSTGYAQDLKNNSQGKNVVANAPKDLLQQHLKMLNELRTYDNNYLSTIDSYNSQLATMKSCYNNLLSKPIQVTDEFGHTSTGMSAGFPATEPRMAAANSFYNNKKNSNDENALITKAELNKIAFTSKLITNTISIIDNSNSTDEITDTFKEYQDTVKNQDLPDITSGASKMGEQLTFAGELRVSTMQGGELFNLNSTCTSMQQELNTQNYGGSGI